MRLAELRAGVVVVACAVSAGVHGALVPDHFGEATRAGLGFVAATVVLGSVALMLTLRPRSVLVLAGAVAVFLGLIASYALAVTTGIPALHPAPEVIDGLALFTKAVEAVGAVTATTLLLGRPSLAATFHQPKGTLT